MAEQNNAKGRLSKPIGSDEIGNWLMSDANKSLLVRHLHNYFSLDYSGKYFESFIQNSSPDQFTPWDILAVESLSITVPSEKALRLLVDTGHIVDLIRQVRVEMREGCETPWRCRPELLLDGSPLSNLYFHLREKLELGRVTTSKLLAAKFPQLVPIRDSLVERLLGLEKSREWWTPISRIFRECPSLESRLDGLPLPVGAPEVTTLRRLDVILWMEAKERGLDSQRR